MFASCKHVIVVNVVAVVAIVVVVDVVVVRIMEFLRKRIAVVKELENLLACKTSIPTDEWTLHGLLRMESAERGEDEHAWVPPPQASLWQRGLSLLKRWFSWE